MRNEYEYIVIGMGALGRGTAYWLSKRIGKDVLGLEQFELGHVKGASHDHSRIIRLSYQTPNYVRLAQQAYQSWAEVGDQARQQLVVPTGAIDIEPPNSVQPLDDYFDSLTACDIQYEILDAAEIMRRWPQFRLDDGTRALYQEAGGLVAAAKANDAHLRLATEQGATILDNMPVSNVRSTGNEIEVVAGEQTFRCRRLLVTADAWSNGILKHLGTELPLTITQEQVTYYNSPKVDEFKIDKFPVWIWMNEPQFYGFPVFGENAVKVTEDLGGKQVTTDTRTFDPDKDMLARVDEFMARHLPDAMGPLLYSKTCLYTLPPDRDFVIDSVPNYPNIFIALGAGHSFKFASIIGKILAELAIDNSCNSDIDAFKFDRPAIAQHDPTAPFRYLR